MRDNNLLFRNTSASLTETETSAALEINGTPLKGMAVVINVPKKSAGDTLIATLHHSTNGSAWTTLVNFETVASVTEASTVPFKITRRFATRNKYVRLVLAVAGTSPDFGAVNAHIESMAEWNDLKVGTTATVNP